MSSLRMGAVASCMVLSSMVAGPAFADDPWIITSDVVITEPTEVGDVIVALDGSLTVRDVPEPGLRVTGNLWAVNDSSIRLEDSVIAFMSTYHGQYSLAAIERATIEVTGCDYRVPNFVQHALIAVGDAELTVEDTDFVDAQLVVANDARLQATRLEGNFEVIVQHAARAVLEDIPRSGGDSSIWVWVEFPSGSVASYTPPMPGFVESWSFPPPGASGIPQRITVERCQARLWPMLVREGSDLELRDVSEDSWVVVGLHLPTAATIEGLINQTLYADHELGLEDRTLRLVNASVDTWNLYPQARAHVRVRDSLLGEILSMEHSSVTMERTTIDGTGGFFGARDHSRIIATNCTFTCTVEATQDATIALHRCSVEPYSIDPTGDWTRFGAYDRGRLLADHTGVATTPALGGQGLIAATSIANPPKNPPGPGVQVSLEGTAAQYTLEGGPSPGHWSLREVSARGGRPEVLAEGEGIVEDGLLGVWADSDAGIDSILELVLVDAWGRSLIGRRRVTGTGPRLRPAPSMRVP